MRFLLNNYSGKRKGGKNQKAGQVISVLFLGVLIFAFARGLSQGTLDEY